MAPEQGSPFDSRYDVCGTLLKQSDVLKKWNSRWFFLVEKRLLYWKSQTEAVGGGSRREAAFRACSAC